MKYLIVLALVVLVMGFARPMLRSMGLGRLPGDVTLKFRGRDIYAPFTTTIILSLALTLLVRFL